MSGYPPTPPPPPPNPLFVGLFWATVFSAVFYYGIYKGYGWITGRKSAEEVDDEAILMQGRIESRTRQALFEAVEYQEFYHEPLDPRDLRNTLLDPFAMFALADIAPESMNDMEGAKPRSRMTDAEIQAAGRAAFHLGAGWGGFSFTNEGGIATINDQGNVSWTSTGVSNQGQSHFSNGPAALAAIGNLFSSLFSSGRDDNAPAPQAPPDSPPSPIGEGEI